MAAHPPLLDPPRRSPALLRRLAQAIGTASVATVLGCAWVESRAVDLVASGTASSNDVHRAALTDDLFPSATECRTCHPDHYREWSASPHAYAQLSPVFNSMHGTLLQKTNGTMGDFCIRCHTPIGMTIGEPLFGPNAERAPVSQEGISCVVCHRMSHDVGKASGRRPLGTGDLFAPVYGPRDGSELARVKANPSEFGPVVDAPGEVGRRIHAEAHFFEPITSPGFCGACHDVTLPGGFRLEEAFSEYKRSPAAERGESCQDCHMGVEPGIASGYRTAPAAVVGGVPTAPRKRTNHSFVGPDYSVIHPGLYPHNPDAKELATFDEWAAFDWRAGWGTDDFEDTVDDDGAFPERWASIDDRYDAREILDRQLELLGEVREQGTALLRRGYVLGDVRVRRASERGLAFDVEVRNGTDGHNVPTGFTAERLVFLQVTVTDADGEVVFRSGDLDPNGDVRDLHSRYVHDGKLPLDEQLFSLQSRFLTQMVRGGEREQILAVNHSIDPLPYVRPEVRPTILTGRPFAARIHKQGIEPGGKRVASYAVDASTLTGRAPYSANIKLIAGMVPVNLVGAIAGVGFDYGMSAREIADAVVAGHRTLWERDVVLEVR